jgi:hypothetical protein
MTAEERARVDTAREGAVELSGILLAEGRQALVWQQRMRQIAADLTVPDATDGERLAAARDRFDSLYAGGRNFADFHIWRADQAERIAVNERLSALVQRLRGLLHDG